MVIVGDIDDAGIWNDWICVFSAPAATTFATRIAIGTFHAGCGSARVRPATRRRITSITLPAHTAIRTYAPWTTNSSDAIAASIAKSHATAARRENSAWPKPGNRIVTSVIQTIRPHPIGTVTRARPRGARRPAAP